MPMLFIPGDLTWNDVDRATGASNTLEGRNLSRNARANTSNNLVTYSRRGGGSTSRESRLMDSDSDNEVDEEERIPNDDKDVEDDFGERPPPTPLNESSSRGRDGDDLFYDDFD